jgi:hypothetical protein
LPSAIRTVQLSGSIGACARYGTKYSASTVFAARAMAARASPTATAVAPSCFDSAWNSFRSTAVSRPA